LTKTASEISTKDNFQKPFKNCLLKEMDLKHWIYQSSEV